MNKELKKKNKKEKSKETNKEVRAVVMNERKLNDYVIERKRRGKRMRLKGRDPKNNLGYRGKEVERRKKRREEEKMMRRILKKKERKTNRSMESTEN